MEERPDSGMRHLIGVVITLLVYWVVAWSAYQLSFDVTRGAGVFPPWSPEPNLPRMLRANPPREFNWWIVVSPVMASGPAVVLWLTRLGVRPRLGWLRMFTVWAIVSASLVFVIWRAVVDWDETELRIVHERGEPGDWQDIFKLFLDTERLHQVSWGWFLGALAVGSLVVLAASRPTGRPPTPPASSSNSRSDRASSGSP